MTLRAIAFRAPEVRTLRVAAFAVACFLALGARLTVHFTHSCTELNPWQRKATAEQAHPCHGAPAPGKHGASHGAQHDHDSCSICNWYDHFSVNALYGEPGVQLTVGFHFYTLRARPSLFLAGLRVLVPSARGPPRA